MNALLTPKQSVSKSKFCYSSHSYALSQKNDTDVAHYNFNVHKPILVIFGTDAAERICYRMV